MTLTLDSVLTSSFASFELNPTTYTRFFWTTRMLARCFRFMFSNSFFSFSFCFLAWVNRLILYGEGEVSLSNQGCCHPTLPDRGGPHLLFRAHRLEFNRLVRVLPPASWTPAIEVLLDMMPAEAANLWTETSSACQ